MEALGLAIVQSAVEMENARRDYCTLEQHPYVESKFRVMDGKTS